VCGVMGGEEEEEEWREGDRAQQKAGEREDGSGEWRREAGGWCGMRAGERVAHTKRRQLRRGGREDVNEAVVRQRGRYGGVVERRKRGKAQLRYLRRG